MAFHIVVGADVQFLSAGHCGWRPGIRDVQTPSPEGMESFYQNGLLGAEQANLYGPGGRDIMRVGLPDADASDLVYGINPADETASVPVDGVLDDPAPGTNVCDSRGHYGHPDCGWIDNENTSYQSSTCGYEDDPETWCTVYGGTTTGIFQEGGDSGSPLTTHPATRIPVQAVGVVTTADADFARVDGALDTWNAELYRPAAPHAYDLSGVAGRFAAGDFNGTHKDDVATLVKVDSATARIDVWLSSGTQYNYQGQWGSGGSGYDPALYGDRLVAGDFNGDDEDDLAALYDGAGNEARIHVWLAKAGATNGFEARASWWHVASGYDVSKIGDRLVAGDFNGDTKDDLATIYDYGSSTARIHVFTSNGSTAFTRGDWREEASFVASNIGARLVAGYFNDDAGTDPNEDLAVMYAPDGSEIRLFVWLSNGSSFAARSLWRTESQFAASRVDGRFGADDFDDDGADDLAALHTGVSQATVFVWRSLGNAFTARASWWTSAETNGDHYGERFVASDVDGADGDGDLSGFYDPGDGTERIHVWRSDPATLSFPARNKWWP
jgi:hypothetical protein